MSRWFRLYSDVLDDPKVQRLPPELFKAWVNLLCLASRNEGTLPPLEDIAFALRMSHDVTVTVTAELVTRGLLDDCDGLSPHNWAERQFKSDTPESAAERKRAQRKREKEQQKTENVTTCHSDSHADVTPPEQNRTEQNRTHTEACVREDDPSHWKVVQDILKNHPDALNTWEDEFLTSIKWAFDLSKAQKDKLKAITDRLQATGEETSMWTIKRGSIQFDAWLSHFRKRGNARFYESRDTLTVPSEYPPQECAA